MINIETMNQLSFNHISPPTTTVPLVPPHQIRPFIPPSLTPRDLLSKNIADYRYYSKQFDGLSVYRYACFQQAQNMELNLPYHAISIMASLLWKEESSNVKQMYIDIAEEATRIHNFHNRCKCLCRNMEKCLNITKKYHN
jgi:hypothetical protein